MGILALPKPLRQRFQNVGLARTLATKISGFWTCPNPCVKDFRILDLSKPLRQRFQNFGFLDFQVPRYLKPGPTQARFEISRNLEFQKI